MTNISLDSVDLLSHAMSKAEFEATRAAKRLEYAGSGFIEWGRTAAGHATVNAGIRVTIGTNKFAMGNSSAYADEDKISVTKTPLVNVDGACIDLRFSNADDGLEQSWPKLAAVPVGNKTRDSSTGTVVTHANVATAFAAETSTNKVILSRNDLVGLECWYEKLSTHDLVYPLGNVQYSLPTYKGLTTVNNLIAVSYSGVVAGYGARWSTLTDAQRRVLTQAPENNIFYDELGEFYQLRYRLLTVEGVSGYWSDLDKFTDSVAGSAIHQLPTGYMRLQGKQLTVTPTVSSDDGTLAYAGTHGNRPSSRGVFGNKSAVCTDYDACYFLPIALVARRNMGAYHPDYNPNGTTTFHEASVKNWHWWEDFSTWKTVTSTLDCFTGMVAIPGSAGAVAAGVNYAGRPDNKYFDNVYADDVKDLRMSARKVTDYKRLLDNYWNKAQDGTLRGWGNHLRMKTIAETVTVAGSAAQYGAANTGGAMNFLTSASTNTRNEVSIELSGLVAHSWVLAGDNNEIMVLPRQSVNGDFVYWPFNNNNAYLYGLGAYNNPVSEFNARFPIGTVLSIGALVEDERTARGDTYLACDISAHHANLPSRWLTDGLPGTLIAPPTGSQQDVVLSKKAVGNLLSVVYSTDNGVTWTESTASNNALWSESLNGISAGTVPSTWVVLYFYKAKAHVFTEPWTNTHLLALSGADFINAAASNKGAYLVSEAIDKHGAGTGNTKVRLTEYSTSAVGLGAPTVHYPHTTTAANGVGGAAKFLPQLDVSYSQAKLAVVYQEVLTGTDDLGNFISTTPNLRRVANVPDLGGNLIRRGSMSVKLPFFVSEGN